MITYSQHLAPLQKGSAVRAVIRRGIVGLLTISGLARFVILRRIRSQLSDASLLRKSDQLITLRNETRNKSRLCLYAHWDLGEDISDHDTRFIEWLESNDLKVIVVSTAKLEDHSTNVRKLRHQGVVISQRVNSGFDFASWAAGLELIGDQLFELDQLVFINSSIYGPLQNGIDIFRPPTPFTNVYGITASREFVPHAQSYFLSFDPVAIRDPSFLPFFRSHSSQTNKWDVIIDCELRWFEYFRRAGLNVATHFEPPRRRTINPLTRHWLGLLRAGFPFVKKSLFIQNYDKVDLGEWEEELRSIAEDDVVEMIRKDVVRRRAN